MKRERIDSLIKEIVVMKMIEFPKETILYYLEDQV